MLETVLTRSKDSKDSTTSSASTSEQTTSVASQTSTGTASETSSDTKTASDQTTTGTNTASTTNTKDKDSKTKSTTSTSISINPADAAGGISMITPASTSTTYYKIGQTITFVWNYTSLSVSPTAVDVVASCSLNSVTYTVTQNMSMEATGTAIWDTGAYQANATIPLLTATYTLFVVDSDKSLTDTASAGHLGSTVGYSFGMYIPQSPTPLNGMSTSYQLSVSITQTNEQAGFFCVTCSSAMSEISRTGLKFVFGMAMITFLSFSWFAGTFGLFSL